MDLQELQESQLSSLERQSNRESLISSDSATRAPQIKLFAKVPKQITESSLEKPELMRLSAVYELIETEIDYVNDLQTMINFHKVQLALVVSEQDVASIFSNVDELLAAHMVILSLNLDLDEQDGG